MQLKELKNTVVNLKTQEEYDELMQMYEDAGWCWYDGEIPKYNNNWKQYKENTGVIIQNYFQYDDIEFYKKNGFAILSLQELKDMTQREYKLGEIVSVKVYIDDIYCLETAKIIEITKNIFGKKRYLVLFEDNQIMNCSSRRFINHS